MLFGEIHAHLGVHHVIAGNRAGELRRTLECVAFDILPVNAVAEPFEVCEGDPSLPCVQSSIELVLRGIERGYDGVVRTGDELVVAVVEGV